ncbi:MAG: pyridoxamine 5'-phosphate oxidase family protein [Actinomycetota bacterium]|nr:pyridoxamine 5'-phosphate oxidase family protein [Actinomycetota bacterium]
MGRTYEQIDERLAGWIMDQPVFFVATAPLAGEGFVNCSPKGNRKELAVLGPRRVAYLDQTGSGAETIGHLRENGRIVVMFCAFGGPPRIVRLHGTGRVLVENDEEFAESLRNFPRAEGIGTRAIISIEVSRISDSCGYGVPLMTFAGHRPNMDRWAERKGRSGVLAYQHEMNAETLDGLPALDGLGSATR